MKPFRNVSKPMKSHKYSAFNNFVLFTVINVEYFAFTSGFRFLKNHQAKKDEKYAKCVNIIVKPDETVLRKNGGKRTQF